MLREKYLDKEVVIAGDEIIGVYDDLGSALDETIKTRPLGSFTIKHVRAQPETITLTPFFEERPRFDLVIGMFSDGKISIDDFLEEKQQEKKLEI
ncbi:MAG: hypothetical protein LBK44_03820 [Spirochaetales bacterium]|jgi:hypothetical protein|nr:hypothetical protein [Spirochaetales bacterium]